jgi:hypothetical protein
MIRFAVARLHFLLLGEQREKIGFLTLNELTELQHG